MANQPKAKPGSTLHYEQTRRTRALAEKEELLNKKRKGELLDRATVEAEWFKIGRQVRDRQANIPARLAGMLVGMKDQHKIHQLIEKELRESQEGLGGGDT